MEDRLSLRVVTVESRLCKRDRLFLHAEQNYDNYALHSVRKMSSTCVLLFFCVGSKYSANMTSLLLGRRLRTNSLENNSLSGAWGAQVPILGSCSIPKDLILALRRALLQSLLLMVIWMSLSEVSWQTHTLRRQTEVSSLFAYSP